VDLDPWIRIRGSVPLTNDPYSDPDPVIFVIDLQDANKKTNLKKVFLLTVLLFEGTFASFFK
jgi:hypothetical protein